MTKHDTWVYLVPDSPLEDYLHLFPGGIPMRDPFGMERVTADSGRTIVLWIVDLDRLSQNQFDALAEAIASKCNVTPEKIADDARTNGGFAINGDWIASMECGPEGFARTKELADFLETAPQPPSGEALNEFFTSQRRRWIDGDEIPPPLPKGIENFDPRLVTPELEAALKAQQVSEALGGYSVLDVLTGTAMVDILNQLDPENEYSVVGWDGDGEEEDF